MVSSILFRRTALYLIVVFVTFGVWLGFGQLRRTIYPACDPGWWHSWCELPSDYTKHDPYCILDPTCVTVFANPDDLYALTPYGEGLAALGPGATIGDGSGIPHNGMLLLAVPNYILFTALCAYGIVRIGSDVKRVMLRQLALTAFFTWYVLEVARWIIASTRDTETSFLQVETYGIALLLLVPIGVTAYLNRVRFVR